MTKTLHSLNSSTAKGFLRGGAFTLMVRLDGRRGSKTDNFALYYTYFEKQVPTRLHIGLLHD